MGLILWASIADFESFNGSVEANTGVVVSIVHSFLGLVATTGFAYYIISSERVNIVI